MLTPVRSTHFSWSLKLGTFFMLNILNAFDEILRGDYRLNNCH